MAATCPDMKEGIATAALPFVFRLDGNGAAVAVANACYELSRTTPEFRCQAPFAMPLSRPFCIPHTGATPRLAVPSTHIAS